MVGNRKKTKTRFFVFLKYAMFWIVSNYTSVVIMMDEKK